MYSSYTTLAAEQEMIPKRPSIVPINGRKKPCQYTPLEVFRYRVKSGTSGGKMIMVSRYVRQPGMACALRVTQLVAIVAQPPEQDIMAARVSHDLCDP